MNPAFGFSFSVKVTAFFSHSSKTNSDITSFFVTFLLKTNSKTPLSAIAKTLPAMSRSVTGSFLTVSGDSTSELCSFLKEAATVNQVQSGLEFLWEASKRSKLRAFTGPRGQNRFKAE